MDVLTISDFDKICRTCLIQSKNLSSIFSPNITESLMECTGVKVSFNDGLPSLICNDCIQNIYQAIHFKRLCLNSQDTLKNILKNEENTASESNTSTIKEELESDEKDFINYLSVDSNNENDMNNTDKVKVEEITIKHKKSNCKNSQKEKINKDQIKISKLLAKKQKLTCNECGKLCPNSSKLRRHQQIHKSKEDRFFYCQTCEKSFLSVDILKRHQKHFHEGKQRKEICNICGKSYSQLRTHMNVKHSDNKPHQCTKCDRRFPYRSLLVTHIREKHEGVQSEKLALCMECGKSFRTGGQLNAHQLTHSGLRKFKCKICGKSYKLSGGLQYHMKAHRNEKNHMCTHCEKKFYTQTALRRHIRIHTGERPYACTVCNKTFNQTSILKTHMKVHSI